MSFLTPSYHHKFTFLSFFFYRESDKNSKFPEDEYIEKNRKEDFAIPEEDTDLSDTSSIRNPFTESSSGEWYV